jgi:hypothetical protein
MEELATLIVQLSHCFLAELPVDHIQKEQPYIRRSDKRPRHKTAASDERRKDAQLDHLAGSRAGGLKGSSRVAHHTPKNAC